MTAMENMIIHMKGTTTMIILLQSLLRVQDSSLYTSSKQLYTGFLLEYMEAAEDPMATPMPYQQVWLRKVDPIKAMLTTIQVHQIKRRMACK